MTEQEGDRIIPARMLNEVVYRPRLFYLERVAGDWEERPLPCRGSGSIGGWMRTRRLSLSRRRLAAWKSAGPRARSGRCAAVRPAPSSCEGSGTSRVCRHAVCGDTRVPRSWRSGRDASSDIERRCPAYGWNVAAGEIGIEIAQMHFQVLEGLSLREVVWELLDVAQPESAVLPVHEPQRIHARIIGWPRGRRKVSAAPPSRDRRGRTRCNSASARLRTWAQRRLASRRSSGSMRCGGTMKAP